MSEKNIAWPEDSGLYGLTQWANDSSKYSTIPTMLIPPPAWRTAWPSKFGNGFYANSTDTNLPSNLF
jgi:hypothetical protein